MGNRHSDWFVGSGSDYSRRLLCIYPLVRSWLDGRHARFSFLGRSPHHANPSLRVLEKTRRTCGRLFLTAHDPRFSFQYWHSDVDCAGSDLPGAGFERATVAIQPAASSPNRPNPRRLSKLWSLGAGRLESLPVLWKSSGLTLPQNGNKRPVS